MPTLTAPPPPVAIPRPAPQLESPEIAFFGRTLAEYTQFFALDLAALRGRDVLDVGAGPSSFAAEAGARKVDTVALDPLYDETPAELAARIERDYAKTFAEIRASRKFFKVGARGPTRPELQRTSSPGRVGTAAPAFFESLAAAEADRQLAAQRFLADYAAHRLHGRYVCATLPQIPFFDGTFDLVLCAHLLFATSARCDFEWHVAACRELVRVSADEARIFPLGGTNRKPYPQFAALRRELKAAGIASEVRAVDYEFFNGTNSMLVLRRTATG